mgnify:CR=1 FL=1
MSINRLVNKFEYALFRHRALVITGFILATLFLLFKATTIKLDAAFTKNIPLKHEYMQTYLKHEQDFGGANNILIAMCDASGDIFNANFFDSLRRAHDDVVYTPGVERVLVKSLFSPSTRFVEVVEDGFAGGPVIPADFIANEAGLAKVKENTEKAGIVGRMVADEYSCAMISASSAGSMSPASMDNSWPTFMAAPRICASLSATRRTLSVVNNMPALVGRLPCAS